LDAAGGRDPSLKQLQGLSGRDELIRFIRFVTSKSQRAVLELLDRVAYGVSVSIAQAAEYGKRHRDAPGFADRLIEILSRGLGRLGLKRTSVHALDGAGEQRRQ
jgi:hypothetical protein